jgi:RNA polymerase sigma-70 factor (sigma-E family)
MTLSPDLVEFCQREHPRLIGMLMLHCGDRSLSEELAQDTLARVCNKWRRVRNMDAPEAWTYRVAVNLAMSHFRRKAAERRAYARANSYAAAEIADRDVPLEVAIRTAITDLPFRQRTTLVLRYYLDLSVDETAYVMDCPEGTVKSLTHRAVERLRSTLGTELRERIDDA